MANVNQIEAGSRNRLKSGKSTSGVLNDVIYEFLTWHLPIQEEITFMSDERFELHYLETVYVKQINFQAEIFHVHLHFRYFSKTNWEKCKGDEENVEKARH